MRKVAPLLIGAALIAWPVSAQFTGSTAPIASATRLGIIKSDNGVTTAIAADGTITSVGAVASSIDAAGATAITNGTNGNVLVQTAGKVAEIVPGTGVLTALGTAVSGSGAICLVTGSACAGGLTINSSTISGGAANKILYDDGTKLQETTLTAGTPDLLIAVPGTISSTFASQTNATNNHTILSTEVTYTQKATFAGATAWTLPAIGSNAAFGAGMSMGLCPTGGDLTLTVTTNTLNNQSAPFIPQYSCAMIADPDGLQYSAFFGVPYYDGNVAHVLSGTGTWISVAGGGTVSSIATTGPITGGTITTTGTIACATCVTSAAALTANQIVIGSGAQASATLGSLGTTTTVLHGNAGGAPSFGAVSLTADVSNVLPVANGGTNLASYAVGDVLYASGTTTVGKLADVATGQVLHSGGVNTAPAYSAIVVGDLPGSGATTVSGQTCTLNSTCKVPIPIMAEGASLLAQASTVYFGVSGGTSNATEINREVPTPKALTIGTFYCAAASAPPAGQTVTITLRVNGASPASGPVCTVTGTGTTGSDLVDTATVAAGDLLDVMVVTSATTGSISSVSWGLIAQ